MPRKRAPLASLQLADANVPEIPKDSKAVLLEDMIDEIDEEIEARSSSILASAAEAMDALRTEFQLLLELFPKSLREMTMNDFRSKYNADISLFNSRSFENHAVTPGKGAVPSTAGEAVMKKPPRPRGRAGKTPLPPLHPEGNISLLPCPSLKKGLVFSKDSLKGHNFQEGPLRSHLSIIHICRHQLSRASLVMGLQALQWVPHPACSLLPGEPRQPFGSRLH